MTKFNNKGFTYIELVLAMAIISFIVLAFTQLFLRSSVSVESAELQTLAYNFAADKMEELRNTAFAAIVNEGPADDANTQALGQAGKIFQRQVIVTPTASTNLIQVDVIVTWIEGGQNRQVQITSLIANYV